MTELFAAGRDAKPMTNKTPRRALSAVGDDSADLGPGRDRRVRRSPVVGELRDLRGGHQPIGAERLGGKPRARTIADLGRLLAYIRLAWGTSFWSSLSALAWPFISSARPRKRLPGRRPRRARQSRGSSTQAGAPPDSGLRPRSGATMERFRGACPRSVRSDTCHRTPAQNQAAPFRTGRWGRR